MPALVFRLHAFLETIMSKPQPFVFALACEVLRPDVVPETIDMN